MLRKYLKLSGYKFGRELESLRKCGTTRAPSTRSGSSKRFVQLGGAIGLEWVEGSDENSSKFCVRQGLVDCQAEQTTVVDSIRKFDTWQTRECQYQAVIANVWVVISPAPSFGVRIWPRLTSAGGNLFRSNIMGIPQHLLPSYSTSLFEHPSDEVEA